MTSTPGVAPYFDLSFQHASGSVLRAMRRFGDTERFCALIDQIRHACPDAGIRSNFIVGFPGETAGDLAELERFLSLARLDAIGIFGYSDEEGTEAASLPGHLEPEEIARRADELSDIAEEVMAQRAADRVGETVEVLIEEDLGGQRLRGPGGPPGTRGGRGDDRGLAGAAGRRRHGRRHGHRVRGGRPDGRRPARRAAARPAALTGRAGAAGR